MQFKMDHQFSTYVKFSSKLTFLTPRNTHVRVLIGVINVSFWEIFAYILNEK